MNPEGVVASPRPVPADDIPTRKDRFAAPAYLLVAALILVAQVIFYRRLVLAAVPVQAGQFGLANSALGAAGLLALPILALHLAFRLFITQKMVPDARLRTLREAHPVALESLAWAWGGVCVVLVFLPMPVPALPSFSLQLFELMAAFLFMGGIRAWAVCDEAGQTKRWLVLAIAAALTLVATGSGLTTIEPQAEAVLASFVLAGFITLTPALASKPVAWLPRLRAFSVFVDADFRRFVLATLCVVVGIYLFTSADLIASLQWFDLRMVNTNLPNVQLRHALDDYQATGLCLRAILWGAQPLLWLLYRDRAALQKSTVRSLRHFWFYLVAVLLGCLAFGWLSLPGRPLDNVTGIYGPTFAGVALPLALLQGLAVFCLASRRYPECHMLAACSAVYAFILAWFGHRPDILLPDMFGVALISLTVLLLVGVVRWGRRQP